MTAAYFGYWGKADARVGGHHPPAFHVLDVAAVAERLRRGDRGR